MSPEDWTRAQELRNRDKDRRQRSSVYRFTSLVKCESYRHNFVGMTRSNRKKIMSRSYVGNGRLSSSRSVCDRNTVAQGKLEGPIVELIKEIYFGIEDETELDDAVRDELAADNAEYGL